MVKIKTDNDDDDEPFFRVRFIGKTLTKSKKYYWEKYNYLTKTWFRLCNKCVEQICQSSKTLCSYHYHKPIMKKKVKRLNKKNHSLDINTNENFNESLGIVISISSSLNNKQILLIKEFIKKFNTNFQSIQFTCESQLDYIDETTTHIITNDLGLYTTQLTKEILQGCVRHIFISSIKWIELSLKQSYILDHFPYEILREKNSLINTRGIKQCRFDQLPVFPSSSIISIECYNGIKQLKLTRDELIEIIELSGASLLNDYIQYKTLIILCNTKKEMFERKKSMNNEEKTIYYCKPAFIFDSIVRHQVQDIEKYLW